MDATRASWAALSDDVTDHGFEMYDELLETDLKLYALIAAGLLVVGAGAVLVWRAREA
jgi:hypothetical protein